MTSGDDVELLARLSEADFAPIAAGLKRTPMTQLALGATGLVQPLEAMAKWPAPVPVSVAVLGVTVPRESLVNVTFWTALWVLTSWLPKASEFGLWARW